MKLKDWTEEEHQEIREAFRKTAYGREMLSNLEAMSPRKRALAMKQLRNMAKLVSQSRRKAKGKEAMKNEQKNLES